MKQLKFTYFAVTTVDKTDTLYALDHEGQIWIRNEEWDKGKVTLVWSKINQMVEDENSPLSSHSIIPIQMVNIHSITPLLPVCCYLCATPTQRSSIFIVCPTCGNKRCPKATNHRLACTNSNEPEQEGSRFKFEWREPTEDSPLSSNDSK